MINQKLKLGAVVGVVILTQTLSVFAQDTDVNTLLRRIDELEQRVKVLDRNRELAEEATAEKAKTTAKVSLGAGGFSVASADSNFTFKVRGYVQTDGRFYGSDRVDTAANDTFLIRRARPIFEGTVYQKFDYRVMLDFGAQSSLSTANNALLQDAFVTARILPEFQIVAGKMKEPVGLERLQSGSNLLFPERAYPTQLVPNRDVGLQLQGDLFGGLLRYEAGIFNGVADGGSGDFDTDPDKDVAGRLFALPFRSSGIEALEGLGIGVAGTYGEQSGSLRNYVSAGLQRFFTYRNSTVTTSPTRYWLMECTGVLRRRHITIGGRLVCSPSMPFHRKRSSKLAAGNWPASTSALRTPDGRSQPRILSLAMRIVRVVVPRKPVTLGEGGGWGALELAARVTQLDVDDDAFPIYANPATAATKATTWSVGANWHLNRNLKLSLAYDHTTFDAAAGNPYADDGEDVIITRVQFAF